MNLKLSHCFITVHDQDEALAFYRDTLGLALRADVPLGRMRWVTVGLPSQPGVEIALETPDGRPGETDALRNLMTEGALPGVIFETDDCDAVCEKLLEGGAEVLHEPTDQLYGVRDCAFRDPSGNMVRFSQLRTG